MSRSFDALARNQAEFPPPGLAALIEELEKIKAKLPAPSTGSLDAPGIELEPAIRTERLHIGARSPLLPFDGSHWEAAEQYRIARTRITQHPRQPSMLVVSSAGPGDGKTVTAINFSASLSLKTEGNVLLVDADLRRSSVHKQLGLAPGAGLAEVLEGRGSLEESLVRLEQLRNLYILQAGNPASNPGELLDSSRWKDVAKQLRQLFRYVIVDSPAMAGVADYELIQAVCDGTLLVLRPDHTKRSMAMEALKAIPKDRLIGVLMNCVPGWCLEDSSRDSHGLREGGRQRRFPFFRDSQ
jgi:capsular exopolysaccharide synthesis family protein